MAKSGNAYTRNHYVPEWYQRRFLLPSSKEQKFIHLDLHPQQFRDAQGHLRAKTALHRWGPSRCFAQENLYRTQFGNWSSTEIEEKFFGRVDDRGPAAVDYFSNFNHPSANHDAFNAFVPFLSIQKLRTPKGLSDLAHLTQTKEKNALLIKMQQYNQLYCAIWTECVWAIVDASEARTKFILSDHPVTVYNSRWPPLNDGRRENLSPDVRCVGSHTLFPLSLDKLLILTNLAWVRNPYQNPLRDRPNAVFFRGSFFDFQSIQVGRKLTDDEVRAINLIIKRSAQRFVAAAKEEWLYPEDFVPSNWQKIADNYLLMPDPRSVAFGGEVVFGYESGAADVFDEYGRKPWQEGFKDKKRSDEEWKTFHHFQGEYARKFGPRKRGVSYQLGRLDNEEDDADYHKYVMSGENKKGKTRSELWPRHLRNKARKA